MPNLEDSISLSGYSKVSLYPPLSADEEYAQFKNYHALKAIAENKRKNSRTIEKKLEEARSALFIHNLRLVISIARNYINRGVHFHDLINEGSIGLLESIELFDYTRGLRFSTYAAWRIKQAIIRFIGDQANSIRLPMHALYLLKKYRFTTNTLMQQHGRAPNMQEISVSLNASPSSIQRVLNATGENFDQKSENDTVYECADTRISDYENTDIITKTIVHRLLATLTPRENDILKMHFGLEGSAPHTYDEISNYIGVTKERVRQIQKRALEKLRTLVPVSKE